MTEVVEERTAIGRLSQYRLFEAGGKSAREAKEDLIVATLAEMGGTAPSIAACAVSMATLWSLQYDELELALPMTRLIRDGRITRAHDGEVALSTDQQRTLNEAAEASRITEATAMREWRDVLRQRWPGLSDAECEQFEDDLRKFLEVLLQRHGAEAALLVYPDDPAAKKLFEESNPMLSALGSDTNRERREWAITLFMREATDAQKEYLASNLNTAYFVAALTIDPTGAQMVQELISGQRVYLDTNFLYRLLGVQGPRYVKAAETILKATQAAGYECAVTPWTVNEYRESLERSRKFLERYPIPPEEFAAVAADAVTVEDFVTSYWREVRSTKLDVRDYVAYHMEVETHLKDRSVALLDTGVIEIDRWTERISAEIATLERVLSKEKRIEVLEHDVKHRLLVEKLRGDGNRTVANAGYWFITHDRSLPRYDLLAQRSEDTKGHPLQFCVSAGAWFQLVEAFKPKTNDFAQTLADVIASPYVHPRTSISKQTAQSVSARVALHKNASPELAARLFMNSALMAEIEQAPDSDNREALIENGIIASAREAQEEAQKALAKAAVDQEQARRATTDASLLVRASEEKRKQELERIETQAKEAVLNERARASEAAKNADERHGREMQSTREAHERRLQEKDRLLTQQQAVAAKMRRRIRLAIAAAALAAMFIAAGLAGLFSRAWEYFGVVVVIASFFGVLDQFIDRGAP
jgi:predicted nucleic acid-binding protein